MTFEEAVKLLYVSFDSTLKANLSVGMPLDLQTLEEGSFQVGQSRRINEDDPYFLTVSSRWGDALKLAFDSLPDYEF
jgi:putative proteasome-type protease